MIYTLIHIVRSICVVFGLDKVNCCTVLVCPGKVNLVSSRISLDIFNYGNLNTHAHMSLLRLEPQHDNREYPLDDVLMFK